ncbi:proteasome subunit beta type-3 isoform X1 [Anguilla rostrata]|uniref:proteasome subunit beta type-3 isoform X1 n=1 Tax=Anguilla rostrata TaxID=7938 RepID=UPI0030CD29FB
MSIMSYNGGAVMAMRGKDCVAIASDRRFGVQAQMVTTDFQKIFPMGERLYIGLAGLATDVQTVSQRLKFRLNLYELKEGRQIKPKTFMSMVSNLLYERRFGPYYIEPVIAGLDPKTFEPFICSLDLIGCPMVTEDFVVSGTCSEQMYGMCESLWEPDMILQHYSGQYSWHSAFRQSQIHPSDCHIVNCDSSLQRAHFHCSRVQWQCAYRPLQPMLGIAHGGLRFVYGCSTMETHFMALLTNSSCADVIFRGSLEFSSECCV